MRGGAAVGARVRDNTVIYPPSDVRDRLELQKVYSPEEAERSTGRGWSSSRDVTRPVTATSTPRRTSRASGRTAAPTPTPVPLRICNLVEQIDHIEPRGERAVAGDGEHMREAGVDLV